MLSFKKIVENDACNQGPIKLTEVKKLLYVVKNCENFFYHDELDE